MARKIKFIAMILTSLIAAASFVNRQFRVETPDHLSIAVQEFGDPKAPPVILIHGLLQSHLSWAKQTQGDFAKRFHVITYDLRGHGSSDSPTNPVYYRSSTRWAGELRAVIRGAHVTRPILVGWSMGGTVISDYLKVYGSKGLRGLVYLDSWINAPKAQMRANSSVIAKMAANDLETRIHFRETFLRACYLHQPSPSEFAEQLACNMLTSPSALSAMVDRNFDSDRIARQTLIPVLVYHGDHDLLMPFSNARHTAQTFPHAHLVVDKNAGHASFFEDPDGFERTFAEFCSGTH